MNIDKKINQLKQAFFTKDIFLRISINEYFSYLHGKVFKKIILHPASKEEMELRALKRKLEFECEELSGWEKQNKRADIKKIKEQIDEIKYRKIEFKNKIELLIYLAEWYGGVNA